LVFLDHPLWGVGFDGFMEAVQPFIASGQLPTAVGTLNPHSQFFDKLVVFGWVGPVLVFGIYFRFIKFCHSYRTQQKALATAGLLLAIGYIDFGLVEFVWYRNNMGVFFTMMMAIISGQLAYCSLNPVLMNGFAPAGDTNCEC
jgi:O-antigen ligase